MSAKLERLMNRLGGIARGLDALSTRLADVEDELRRLARPAGATQWSDSLAQLDARDQVAAQTGIRSFSMVWLHRQRARVFIDGKKLDLSPRLAALLALLASNDIGAVDDDDLFVAWKPMKEIGRQLWPKSVEADGAHAAAQGLCRLRKALRGAGINHHYLQSERGHGARLALRRDHAGGMTA